jgi:L-amino acid N-acyltransferase
MEIKLREASAADIENILAIVNYSILHTTNNYNYTIVSLETQKEWFENKKSKNLPLLVADYNGKVIGYATYGSFRERIGYQFTIEHSVYVSESFVGKGVGTLLLTELIRRAKNQGFHTMIGAIDAKNKDSIAFHEKFGFKITGTIREVGFKFDKWLDLVFMQLLLE